MAGLGQALHTGPGCDWSCYVSVGSEEPSWTPFEGDYWWASSDFCGAEVSIGSRPCYQRDTPLACIGFDSIAKELLNSGEIEYV